MGGGGGDVSACGIHVHGRMSQCSAQCRSCLFSCLWFSLLVVVVLFTAWRCLNVYIAYIWILYSTHSSSMYWLVYINYFILFQGGSVLGAWTAFKIPPIQGKELHTVVDASERFDCLPCSTLCGSVCCRGHANLFFKSSSRFCWAAECPLPDLHSAAWHASSSEWW